MTWTGDIDPVQDREWQILHDRITETLDHFGRKDPFGRGDYWLIDDNMGPRRHDLAFQNLNLFQPLIISTLQKLLVDFPRWQIFVAVDVIGKENEWPGMGVVIGKDYIVDELQRKYLPKEFQTITYPGSRRVFD